MTPSNVTAIVSPSSFVWTRTIIEFALLLCLSFIIAFFVNFVSPVGIPLVGNWNPKYLIIDARSRDDYESGHIPSATSLPRGEIESRVEEFVGRVPMEQNIIVYCTGIECHDSHDVATILKDHARLS